MIRFFDYSHFHGKSEAVGSTYLRVNQLIKYWPEAGLYKYGENPEALIFQKVFASPDYQFPINFKGVKILDICDPMWLDGFNVVETCNAMDAITCPTESLAEFVRQFHNNVIVVPDRFDIELLLEPKKHNDQAKTVVWFGYSHNIETLKPAVNLIQELGLELIVISNEDPMVIGWGKNKDHWYAYKKYNEGTIWEDIQRGDFVVFPDGFRPIDIFKSSNRTIRANLCGLPVARDADEVRLYIDPNERRKWFDENYATIKEEYDVRKSVKQYKNIISGIRKNRKI